MTLHALAQIVAGEPDVSKVVTELADTISGAAIDVTGPSPLRPFLAAAVSRPDSCVLMVTATAREGEDLVVEIGGLMGPEVVAWFPAWETLPHERLSPRSDTVGRRLAVLRRLVHPTG
ncbi:hypothetical protein, partial [Aeromicrobium sp.]|uniref:hypothetical protein n=1 Tax=Aeromicrobium sp. TaxID=1871063 RepID=UPI0019A8C843